MRKYTITSIDKLKPGDQFVKEGDVNEIVFTVLDMPHKEASYYVRKGELRMTDIVNKKESIIFLRHGKL